MAYSSGRKVSANCRLRRLLPQPCAKTTAMQWIHAPQPSSSRSGSDGHGQPIGHGDASSQRERTRFRKIPSAM